MYRLVIGISAAIALTLAVIIVSATGVNASDVMVSAGFVRASATPAATSAAAYVTVTNHADRPERLLAVSTPAAAAAIVHTSVMAGDVMKMREVDGVLIPPQGMIEMKPGGMHIMLTGLKAPLRQGGSIALTLTFERAGAITVAVPVGGVAATSHDHAAGSSGD